MLLLSIAFHYYIPWFLPMSSISMPFSSFSFANYLWAKNPRIQNEGRKYVYDFQA